jgi:hypothetical protein
VKRLLCALLVLSLTSACAPGEPSAAPAYESASSAIRGGEPVAAEDPIARSTVFLSRDGRRQCTASLLSDSLAITAAHCVDHRHRARIEFTEGFSLGFGASQERPVVAWRFHPGWVEGLRSKQKANDTDVEDGDVVLLRFAGGLPAGFAPADLLSSEVQLRNGDEVILAGYGSQDDRALDQADGGILRRAPVNVLRARENYYEVHLDQRQGKGACKGDSGGPAFLVQNGQTYLWGVTSRMIEWQDGVEYLCQRTSVYADIRRLNPWLGQAIAELSNAR